MATNMTLNVDFVPLEYSAGTKCVGSPGMIHDGTTDCHSYFLAWMRPQALLRKLRGSLNVLGLVFDMLSMCVCKTWHWHSDVQSTGAVYKHTFS